MHDERRTNAMTDTPLNANAASPAEPLLEGWLRSDGRKGIRNVVAVAYLVECAHHVAREIVAQFREPLYDADHAFDDAQAQPEPRYPGRPQSVRIWRFRCPPGR